MSEKAAAGGPSELIPNARLRQMQIIAGALVLGLVMFGAIAVRLGPQIRANAGPNDGFITLAAGLFFVGSLGLSIVMPRVSTRAAMRRIATGAPDPSPTSRIAISAYGLIRNLVFRYLDEKYGHLRPTSVGERLLMQYQTEIILGLAALEGAGFFAGIALLLENRWEAAAVLVMIVGLMMLRFPTRRHVENWMIRQSEQIQRLRVS